jgi:hypothetical protein
MKQYPITEQELFRLAELAQRLRPDLAEPIETILRDVAEHGEIDPDELIDLEPVDEEDDFDALCEDCPYQLFCSHPGHPEDELSDEEAEFLRGIAKVLTIR